MINLELIGTDLGLLINVLDVDLQYHLLEVETSAGKYCISPLAACSDYDKNELDEYDRHFSKAVTAFESVEHFKDNPDTNILISVDIFGAGYLNCQDYSLLG
ncbi:hypothetical protein DSM106972_056520 [Dulcicalothrix desertica PCC 7102]|uniref:Uncharacterized protein n=1 Tax=Dulcicalothrix desertica PCC 7102 TaxID=232991 RepID=A0A3S1D388_9CYAN|nr:hypothetical protein [Dulcicalothrix desertica]RUT02732.1 hypothetical protein DSM106972_056520 [Dulcicalothrix desertica PCC 7102]TWH39033.1 hypothetical protein CAL7102_08237 [Dulcicalothrix desertica PCC 7102]